MNRVKSNEGFDVRVGPGRKGLVLLNELGVVGEEGESFAPEILETLPTLTDEGPKIEEREAEIEKSRDGREMAKLSAGSEEIKGFLLHCTAGTKMPFYCIKHTKMYTYRATPWQKKAVNST
ncbi:hypothetical protein FF1_037403 [Malus domestica]